MIGTILTAATLSLGESVNLIKCSQTVVPCVCDEQPDI